MKAIQTFWTKPFIKPASCSFESRYQGGFNDDKQFIYTWALSLLSIKEFFPKVHLVTDKEGKKSWIDFFEFPYDSYSTELDKISDLPTDFWAAGKLLTYASTEEPFVHFDVDVVLGKLFDISMLDYDLVVEFHYDDRYLKRYEKIIQKLISSNAFFSKEILIKFKNPSFSYNDYNLGIMGGKDFHFINSYANKAFKDLNANLTLPKDKITCSFLNCIYEQHYLYVETKMASKKVNTLIENSIQFDVDYQKQKIEEGVNQFDFVHFHGGYKRLYPNKSEIWLKKLYPGFFNQIKEKIAFIDSKKLK
jgi:hypothetical protein